jgi:hypothetical protein
MTLPKNEKVRISPRISRATYLLAKDIYRSMGVTFEDRVEDLIRRDLKKEINKPWFKNGMNKLGKELDLPEGMNWEDFWMKWFLSDDPSAYIKVDSTE